MRSGEDGAKATLGLARLLGSSFSDCAAFGVALRLETEGSPIANHRQRDANILIHLDCFTLHRTSGGAALRGALPHLSPPPWADWHHLVSSARASPQSRQDHFHQCAKST